MMQQGIPFSILRWIRSFLQNWTVAVKFNGTLSNGRQMKQGFPQGAVLSAPLFLFYINNLANDLPKTNINSMFDVRGWCCHPGRKTLFGGGRADNPRSSNTGGSGPRNGNCDWMRAKMKQVSSLHLPSEAAWTPEMKVDGERIKYEEFPRLLGVILDRTLQFHHTWIISSLRLSLRSGSYRQCQTQDGDGGRRI